MLPDAILGVILGFTGTSAALGSAAQVSRRWNRLVLDDGGLAWRLLREGPAVSYEAPPVPRRIDHPGGCGTPLAISESGVLFSDLQSEGLLLVPHSATGALAAPLALRHSASCSQAQCGAIALATFEALDPKHASLVVASTGGALPRGARASRVRSSTLSGRSRRSLRVGGSLCALALEEDVVATAVRSHERVSLWEVESATLLLELCAHEAGSEISALELTRGLLVSASSLGSVALHALSNCYGRGGASETPRLASGGLNPDGISPDAVSADAVSAAPHAPTPAATCVMRVRAHGASVDCVHLRGLWLLSGGADLRVCCWSVHKSPARRLCAWELCARPVAVRVASELAVCAGEDGSVSIRQLPGGQVLHQLDLLGSVLPGGRLRQLRLCHSGLLVLAQAAATGHGEADADTRADAFVFEFPKKPPAVSVACYATTAPPAPVESEAGPQGEEPASESARSELSFATAHVHQQMLERYAPRITGEAPEYMAAVLQCIASKLLSEAGAAARESEQGRIEPQHIGRAVREHGELSHLVGGASPAQLLELKLQDSANAAATSSTTS